MYTEKFVKKINKEVSKIRKDFVYSSLGDAFVHLCIRMKFDLDDEDISQYTAIGGKGDKSIDAFWSEDDTRTVYIIQGKFSKKGEARIDRKEITTFGESIEWLTEIKDKDSLQNERLYEASCEYKEEMKKEFGVKLIFFAFGRFMPEAIREKERFNKKHLKSSIEMELIDIAQIENLYSAYITAKEPFLETVELPIKNSEFFIKESPIRSIIGTVKSKDIAQIRISNGTDIYRSDVRYPLGKNRIYQNISSTLKDKQQKNNFWYFNNGLSIVCDSFKLEKDKLTLNNMQIVNGCQTTEVLKDNLGHLSGDVEILLRIVESKDPTLSSRITMNTNTQNPTTPRDLMSNEGIQEKLHKEFRNYDPPYFYERKRGELKAFLDRPLPKNRKEFKKKYSKISNEKMAQAYWAFHGNPATAKSEMGMLFIIKEQKGYYEEIFNKDRTVEELLFPFRMYEYILEKRKSSCSDLKKREAKVDKISNEQKREKEREEVARESFIRYSDFTILAGIGYLCEKYYEDFESIDYECLLANFDEVNEKLYNKIHIELKYLIKDLFKSGFSHISFFKDKNTFEKLKNKVDYAMERSESEEKSYFDGITCFE